MSDRDQLADACTELADLLGDLDAYEHRNGAAAAGLYVTDHLLADKDTCAGVGRRPQPGSRPPWNQAVAAAIMDAHELIRRLEASLRLAVTGHPGPARGGSAAATSAALAAIENLGQAVSEHDRKLATRLLHRAAAHIGQLPAVDSVPRWEKIRPGPDGIPPRCENCRTHSLRVELVSGTVVCVFPGPDGKGCRDLDGRTPPIARLELSRLNGEPILVWRDGTVQAAPAAAHVQAADPEPEHVEPEPADPEPVPEPAPVPEPVHPDLIDLGAARARLADQLGERG